MKSNQIFEYYSCTEWGSILSKRLKKDNITEIVDKVKNINLNKLSFEVGIIYSWHSI